MGTSLLLAFCTSMRQAETRHVHGITRAGGNVVSYLGSFSPPTQSLGMRVLAFIDLAYEKHLAYLKLNHEHLLTVISFPLTPSPLGSYLNAIQTCCPHILRYVTAAVITNKRRQSLLKDLIRVIRQVQSHSYIPFQWVWPQSSFSDVLCIRVYRRSGNCRVVKFSQFCSIRKFF